MSAGNEVLYGIDQQLAGALQRVRKAHEAAKEAGAGAEVLRALQGAQEAPNRAGRAVIQEIMGSPK